MEGVVVDLEFDVQNDKYKKFITKGLSKALASHRDINIMVSPNLTIVRPLLPEQNSGQPERWMGIKLSAVNEKNEIKSTTLAVRGDNVWFTGFMNQEGKWYEFGKEPNSTRFLRGSTFLGFGGTYPELVGSASVWFDKTLGQISAKEAVFELSKYNGGGKKKFKLYLAKMIVMICESARMLWYRKWVVRGWGRDPENTLTEKKNKNQIEYLTNWQKMSRAMMGWAEYSSGLKDIGIKGHRQACNVVHLILNSPPPEMRKEVPSNGKKSALCDHGHPGDGKDHYSQHGDGKGQSSRQRKGNGQSSQHVGGDGHLSNHGDGKGVSSRQREDKGQHGGDNGHPPQPTDGNVNQQQVDHGQSLVEVFTLGTANSNIPFLGSITVLDGRLGQIIFCKKEGGPHSKGNFVLTGPYRGISADGRVALKVLRTTEAEADVSIWDPYTKDERQYDKILTKDIPGDLRLTYAVLSSAVETSVQVDVFLFEKIAVYGEITAQSRLASGEEASVVLLSSGVDSKVEFVASSAGSKIPLARSVVAWPVGSPIDINVNCFHPVTTLTGEGTSSSGSATTTLNFSFEDHTPRVCFKLLDGIGHVRVSIDDTCQYRDEPNNSLPRSLTNQIIQKNTETFVENGLLVAHPNKLTFTIGTNKIMSCLLHLTNKSHDDYIAFRYRPSNGILLNLSGILPPDSTSTYLVRPENLLELNMDALSFILETCVVPEEETEEDMDEIFNKRTNDEIVVLTLPATVYGPAEETTTTSEPIQPRNQMDQAMSDGTKLLEVTQLATIYGPAEETTTTLEMEQAMSDGTKLLEQTLPATVYGLAEETATTSEMDQAMSDGTKLMDVHPSQLTLDLTLGAMGSLLHRLSKLIKKEYKLPTGVQENVRSFFTDLQIMQAALFKVAEVPQDQLDKQVKLWAVNVREMSYDMEDAVDSLLVDVEGCEPNANQDSFKKLRAKMAGLFDNGKALREISTAVKEIHIRLQDDASRDQMFNFTNLPAATRTKPTIGPFLDVFYRDKNIIGIEEARDDIIKKISEGNSVSKEKLKILSIVGFGGLGKTTLAREVYDTLQTEFHYKAFVSLSRDPDIKEVLRNLLFELDKRTDTHNMDEEMLSTEIRELLRKKRYFIIIDDLWNEEAWEAIKYALVDDQCGSVIITTTRLFSVSRICCSSQDDMIHKMKSLSDDDSRKLFYRRIFSSEVCPSRFEQVSKEILKKCGGVPLAIIVLASYMASNGKSKQIEEWHALLKAICCGVRLVDNDVELMKRILSLSFYDLPSHLRACILYLAIFPEDHQINRDRLIRRWISEGFIQVDGEASLIELGNSYFNELVNRSMVQPISIHVDGTVEACRVHDMVHDLICELSRKENFVTVLDVTQGGTRLKKNFRRLSLQKSMRMTTTSMRQVRSFTAFSPAISEIPPLSIFERLHVLDLEGCDLRESPGVDLRHVENLIYLRYLGLRGTQVAELPTEIGNLYLLQTLDLQLTNIKELPSSIVQLEDLMCLILDLDMPLPKGFTNLTCLEQLVGHGVGLFTERSAEELGHLIRLRELAFKWDSRDSPDKYFPWLDDLRSDKPLTESIHHSCSTNEDLIDRLGGILRTDKALIESLGKLRNLESLEISSANKWASNLMQDWVPPPNLRKLKFDGYFKNLPRWICSSSLPLLCYLDLNLEKVRSEDIQILGMLPDLRFVSLLTNLGQGSNIVENLVLSAGAFPRARECHFHELLLVHPTFQPGTMPMVQCLRFGLRVNDILSPDFDLSVRNLTSLQQLRIDLFDNESEPEAYSEAVDTLRRVADDHPGSPALRADKLVQY